MLCSWSARRACMQGFGSRPERMRKSATSTAIRSSLCHSPRLTSRCIGRGTTMLWLGSPWPPEFYPIQKLICHHTATQNRDPDPAATIRSIYYYHAVTQTWGDIGYNFLVDESGRIYEGRYSRPYPTGAYPTGEDATGKGVTGAHAYQ